MAKACLVISNCKKCLHFSCIKACPDPTYRIAICEKLGKRIQIGVKKGKKIEIPQWCPIKID